MKDDEQRGASSRIGSAPVTGRVLPGKASDATLAQSIVGGATRFYEALLSSVARPIGRTGVHPNALTVLSLFPALVAGVFASLGAFAAAALMLLFSGVFDLLDGAVARETGKTSKFGALLDSSLDRLSDAAVPAGLVLYYAPQGAVVLVPVLMILSGFIISYIRARAEGLGIELPRLWMRREDRMFITVLALFLAPLPVPGLDLPGASTLVVIALLAFLGFVAAGMALMAAAQRS